MTDPLGVWSRRLAEASSGDLPGLIDALERDGRAGAARLAEAARRRLAREEAELRRLVALMDFQRGLHGRGLRVIAGVDEVGRGALAGPVTVCAVVLDVETLIPRLDDSKRLRRDVRAVVAAATMDAAVAFALEHAWPDEIDSVGISRATIAAMCRAVAALGPSVDHVVVDGNARLPGVPSTAVVGGDRKVGCVAAASVVAKTHRDALMEELALEHPGYGLEKNRGYGTEDHLDALTRLGPSPVHRRSFSPCSQGSLFGTEGRR